LGKNDLEKSMMEDKFERQLQASACTLQAVIRQFAGAHLLERQTIPLTPDTLMVFGEAFWRISSSASAVEGREDAFDLTVQYTLEEGKATETNLGVSLEFWNWSVDHYVLMPAAVYQGNRFESRHMKYPPILKDPVDIGPDVPMIISDVPRLNNKPGKSRIQQMTRDLATPAIGFYDPQARRGFWLLTDQATRLGDSGIDIDESGDRRQATITVNAPGVRLNERYTIGNTHHPCEDRGADFKVGDSVEIRLRLFSFACPQLQGLFDRFVDIRKDLAGVIALQHQIPFYSAWKIQEEKYNLSNWDEMYGYYAVGTQDDSLYSHWQTGWVGGLMSTYPMLMEGSSLSRQRALRTFDFLMPAGSSMAAPGRGSGLAIISRISKRIGCSSARTAMSYILSSSSSSCCENRTPPGDHHSIGRIAPAVVQTLLCSSGIVTGSSASLLIRRSGI
jgi:hypothetical protein